MGSQEIKRQSFAVDDPFVGLGYIRERVDAFLLELPKGQPIKCLIMDSVDEKQEKRLYFHHAVGANQAYFMAEAYPVSYPHHTVKKERPESFLLADSITETLH